MKGLELPVNMIIVIAIAVLVMVVITAYFVMNMGDTGKTLTLTNAKNDGCQVLASIYDCNIEYLDDVLTNYEVKGRKCNLEGVCYRLNYKTRDICARMCGCVVEADDTPLSNCS